MSLTNERLKKLRRFKTASFAVWPDPIKDLRAIHSRIVILGLNPSAEIKFGENFHGGHFDSWYEKGFSQAPFKGAYMTDLVSDHEPKASVIEKKWRKNEGFKKRNIKNLRKQFKILGV